MDTEKQRQHRRDDVRLTESGNARSKQLNTRGAYRVANQQSLVCLSGSERWRPGWFLDMKYQTCYFIEKGVGLKTLLSQMRSLPLTFVMKHLYKSREYASQYILSTCSLRLLLVSLTESILSHQSIKLTTPCNGYQATFLYNVVHTGFIPNVCIAGRGWWLKACWLPKHAKRASDTYFAFRLHQAHWVDYKDGTCRLGDRLRRDKTSSRKMDPLKQLKCLVKHVWTCASTCCAKQRLPH